MAITALVFAPTLGFPFVSFDDEFHLVRNPDLRLGLGREGLVWAFTTGYGSNWHPITWLSFLLDFELHGFDPGAFHATNLLLHGANTLLFFGVFRAMTRRELPSAFAAALFAIHPLHVESVAWVSERKDLLSAFFALSALWTYVGFTRRPGAARYGCTLALFALGLMAKQMIVTLPFLFLLFDHWPLGRLRSLPLRRAIVEKIPMLALSAAASAAIFQIQQYDDPAAYEGAVPLHLRIANAAIAYARYLGKLFWPVDLSVLYPHPFMPEWGGLPPTAAEVAGAFALLALLTAIAFASRRGYAIVGWLWFLGTLVPVIGLVQVGTQAMADRYTYLPLGGCFVILAWAGDELWGRLRHAGPLRLAIPALALASLVACVQVSAAQVRVWRDSIALYEHALDLDPRNARLRYNLALELGKSGRLEEAASHYRQVLTINPRHVSSLNNLGSVLQAQGEASEAIRHLRRAIALDPDYADAYFNLGNALMDTGDARGAIRSYRRAIRIDPTHAAAHVNCANVLRSRGRLDPAIAHYRSALRADPSRVTALLGLALALEEKGEPDAAVAQLRALLEIDPHHRRAQRELEALRAAPRDSAND